SRPSWSSASPRSSSASPARYSPSGEQHHNTDEEERTMIQTRLTRGALLPARLRRLGRDDHGMSTVEYAIGTVAAAAFGALLYTVVTGDSILTALTDLVRRALTVDFRWAPGLQPVPRGAGAGRRTTATEEPSPSRLRSRCAASRCSSSWPSAPSPRRADPSAASTRPASSPASPPAARPSGAARSPPGSPPPA